MPPGPTQAPNRDRENARPPHCNCIAYLHCAPADWQRPQIGLCSSHFWRRDLHRVQPVKDLDMGSGVEEGREKLCGELWAFRVANFESGERPTLV